MSRARVAVIVGSVEPDPVAGRSVAAFVEEVRGRGEVVVVGASASEAFPGARMVHRPLGMLVPELWRDGLRVVDAELVAFSTSQMVPRAGWLDELVSALDRSGADGVGGTIEPGDGLRPVDRAIYLQRYLSYSSSASLPSRPSGENAIYRRDRLIEVESSWIDGFWETEVQRLIEEQGGVWTMAPGAIMTFEGSTRLRRIVGQRIAHARRFGAIRAEQYGPLNRRIRSLAGPLVPGLMVSRVVRSLIDQKMPICPWLTAFPPFLAIAGAWAGGETIGTLFGLNSK